MNANIFSELTRYTSSPENSLTEAFVFVLKFLLERDVAYAARIINGLAGFDVISINNNICNIQTQFSHEDGRPDIAIEIQNETLIHIEVKHDAPLGHEQLERYYGYLQRQNEFKNRQLVLLSRSKNFPHSTTLAISKYRSVSWYEIEKWLMKGVEAKAIHNDVTRYILESFSDFLSSKRMVMKKISSHYSEGVLDLYHLGIMMEEVLPGNSLRRTCGWEWRGFYTKDSYFFGSYYSRPLTIVFAENYDNIGVTEYRSELDLEQTLFFALTSDEQFQMLADFVQNAYKNRTQISTLNESLSDQCNNEPMA